MSTLSTHVLDAAYGVPAGGLVVALIGPEAEELAVAATDADGRVRFEPQLAPGGYGLYFDTGPWFAAAGRDTFFPGVSLGFAVGDNEHYHVALLLSPYSYTTYKGS
ncbi:5-hydroxyisourate hydrolase [Nocardioides sp. Root1257]|uniref:hydroxyisourate hydrolase n=1 Tax=unclassified Nocardioides TaxID=2615069 RepID=UPI0006FD307A|nr:MULTISPECIES: hydroxyisourate hydrolase [unclassified Nocardioides]KQW46067.1 5-hydroxyisourate hydrolase [Nocardioides sp. Root1257]KRC43329.1 5-hydroxyisourate hydrolase [Nocardioides sp. Root224]